MLRQHKETTNSRMWDLLQDKCPDFKTQCHFLKRLSYIIKAQRPKGGTTRKMDQPVT